ncbi:MAG: choice-of-anchor J domain-containing protein [Bacteroidales bacterium]|nr:choice-of-anchor J domain-containing protein [Bacteroidales bacterium]
MRKFLFLMIMLTIGFNSSISFIQTVQADCSQAINIPTLPVTNQALVCGLDNLNSTNVPGTLCVSGSSASYKDGDEALYTFTATVSGAYEISYTGQTWTSIIVYDGCPTSGGTCISSSASSSSSKTLIVTLTAGTTYYLWFDIWPTPDSPCPGTFSIVVPPSCPKPTALTATNITSTTADLGWTAGGTETLWNIEYGISGFTPTGTPTLSGVTNPQNLTNLTPATVYQFYVQANCGGGDLSVWAGPFSFTTTCLAVSAFTQNFDAVTTPALPVCWSKVGTSGSVSTQTSSNFSTPNCLYMYSSSSTSVAVVSMPMLTNISTGTHFLKFMARANLTTGAKLEVGYLTDASDASTFVVLNSFTLTLTYAEYSVYPGTTPPANSVLAFRANYSPAYSLLIDNVVWDAVPSCPGITPGTFVASNQSANSVDLTWTELGTATQWEIQYGVTGFTMGSGTSVLANVNPYTLGSLNSATTYQVYVRSICTPGDTSTWMGPISFTTACAPYIATLTQNFDGVSTPNLPVCWSKIVVSTSTASRVQTITTTTPFSTPNHVEMYNSPTAGATTHLMLVSPQISDLVGNNWLRFKAKSGASSENLIVGTITDPTDATTFTPIQTINTLTNSYQEFFVLFNNYSGTDEYIAFKHANTTSTRYVYIDDFVWEPIPSCAGIIPGTITSTNPTLNSIDLAWTEWVPASQWQIEYGLSGFTPGSGTLVIANSNPSTLSGLNASSTYQAYVRSICAPGDTSVWRGPFTFSTVCGTFSAPMAQNFDAVSTPNLPLCWSKIVVSTATTARVQTITTTTPFSTPNHIEMFNSSTASATTYLMLVSPQMTDVASATNRLRFMAKRGTNAEDVIVGVLTNPTDGSTFTAIQTIPLTTTYTEYIVNFDSYVGTGEYFAFKHGNTTTTRYVYIDNVVWEPIPTCLEPVYNTLAASNATVNSVDLAWTDNGTPTEWQIQYGLSGFVPGTGTFVTANSNPFTLTGLQHSNSYQAYVRVVCAPGDTSMWRGPVAFATLCGSNDVFPFTEDFEGVTFPPTCWTRFSGLLAAPSTLTAVTSTWISDDFANVTSPVNKSSRINIYGTTVNHWLITPSIDLGTGTDYLLKFDLALTDYANAAAPDMNGVDDKFAVVISTDNGTTWTSANVLRLWDNAGSTSIYNNIPYTGQNISIDLSGYTGVIKIAFYGESTASNADNDLFVDNVTFTEKPPCSTPIPILVDATDTMAIISWTAGGTNATSYQIEWGLEGFTLGTGTVINTTDLSDTLIGLTPGTSYELYVRSVCLYGDTSAWSSALQFTTEQCDAADMCIYTLELEDDYGDGWNNAEFSVLQNGMSLGTFTVSSGNSATFNISVCDGATLEFIWTEGSYDEECALTINNHLGITIFNFGFNDSPLDGDTFFVYLSDCTIPSCLMPSGLYFDNEATTSIDLGWTAGGTEDLWQIEYDTTGFIHGTGIFIVTGDNPYTLNGLTPGTAYDFYVRAICDTVAGDTSDWAGPYSFLTLCGIVNTFPWNDQFDNAILPDVFPCWSKMTSGGETWYVETNQPQFGTYYVGIEYDAVTIQDEYLITPTFDFSYLAHPYISFWWSMSYYWGVDPNDNYDVYLLATTDDGITIDTLWSETDEGVFPNFTWAEKMIDLTAYAGEPTVQIGFNYIGFDGAAFYLDNVTVHDTTTVGIVKPVQTDLDVNIYPNPSEGLFNIVMMNDVEELSLTIMDIQGKVVYEEQLNGITYGSSTELNLRALASGMYHLRLSDGKTILNKKLVIN